MECSAAVVQWDSKKLTALTATVEFPCSPQVSRASFRVLRDLRAEVTFCLASKLTLTRGEGCHQVM